MIRIVARPCRWPELHVRRDRVGLALRWDAVAENGETRVSATTHPLYDGAFALLSRGTDPEALVTMRHEGADHDSFRPIPLRIPAAEGRKRAEGRERIAEHRATERAERMSLRDRSGAGVVHGDGGRT